MVFDLDSRLASGRTLVIAEVGSNHAGDRALALDSIAAAKEAGADVVKFQLYRPETLIDDKFPVLKYIASSEKTQRERFRRFALTEDLVRDLAEESARQGLIFMATPFDEQAADILDPLVPMFKIASGDLTNRPLIEAVVAKGKPVMISTGLGDEAEIDASAALIPSDRLYPLHCVGAYPTPDDQVNLSVIPWLAARLGRPIGYSDHSVGGLACVAAVVLGAGIIEKHFLPMDGIQVADKALSLGVAAFRAMVDDIRRVEAMRGQPGRSLTADESYFRIALRRSLYAKADIAAGAVLDAAMLIPLRPWRPDGVSPMDFTAMVGRRVRHAVAAGELLVLDDLE